jgi:hypothetical protein
VTAKLAQVGSPRRALGHVALGISPPLGQAHQECACVLSPWFILALDFAQGCATQGACLRSVPLICVAWACLGANFSQICAQIVTSDIGYYLLPIDHSLNAV